MLDQYSLDLCRVYVLPPGNDHVLHTIRKKEIAILVKIAGVSGSQPASRLLRPQCRLRIPPVTFHVLGGLNPQLARFARPALTFTIGIDDLQLDPWVGSARGLQPIEPGLVVVPVQLGNRAGSLSQTVHLVKAAAKGSHRRH